jgi:hypothetical protein
MYVPVYIRFADHSYMLGIHVKWIRMKTFFILLIFVLIFGGISSAGKPCLHYEGSPVTLNGKVKLKDFYGPPNYGENPETDSRETQAILILLEPICVVGNEGDLGVEEQNQSEITLVPQNNENLRDYAGKQIMVEGTLFHAHTAHHHTKILISIKKIIKTN